MRKLILSALALAASTVVANAVPITGNYSITSTSDPTITGILANPFSFNLALGAPQTFDLANIYQNSDGLSTVTVTFNFTAPVVGSGAVLEADDFTTPGNSTHDTLTPGVKSTVNFSDGTVVDITLGGDTYNGNAGNYTGLVPTVTFDLITDPSAAGPTPQAVAVPEPLTVSLFFAGLAGAAAVRRRKRQSNA